MTKGKNRQPTRTHAKKGKPSKARENVGDQVTIKTRFASHWLRGCRVFSGPTTERGKAKTKKSRITLDTPGFGNHFPHWSKRTLRDPTPDRCTLYGTGKHGIHYKIGDFQSWGKENCYLENLTNEPWRQTNFMALAGQVKDTISSSIRETYVEPAKKTAKDKSLNRKSSI